MRRAARPSRARALGRSCTSRRDLAACSPRSLPRQLPTRCAPSGCVWFGLQGPRAPACFTLAAAAPTRTLSTRGPHPAIAQVNKCPALGRLCDAPPARSALLSTTGLRGPHLEWPGQLMVCRGHRAARADCPGEEGSAGTRREHGHTLYPSFCTQGRRSVRKWGAVRHLSGPDLASWSLEASGDPAFAPLLRKSLQAALGLPFLLFGQGPPSKALNKSEHSEA